LRDGRILAVRGRQLELDGQFLLLLARQWQPLPNQGRTSGQLGEAVVGIAALGPDRNEIGFLLLQALVKLRQWLRWSSIQVDRRVLALQSDQRLTLRLHAGRCLIDYARIHFRGLGVGIRGLEVVQRLAVEVEELFPGLFSEL